MRQVPRTVWLLSAGIFANMVVSFTFVYLFVYLTGERGLGVASAGLVAGVGGVGLIAGNFTGGWFGDHVGHRRTLLAASVVSGLGLLTLTALPTPPCWWCCRSASTPPGPSGPPTRPWWRPPSRPARGARASR